MREVSVIVDGTPISVPHGATVLHAADAAGPRDSRKDGIRCRMARRQRGSLLQRGGDERIVGEIDPRGLLADGWRRLNVDCDPRLSEAAALYEQLGYEVLLVPVLAERAAEAGACTTCFASDADPDRYKVIYVRPRPGASPDDDLFE